MDSSFFKLLEPLPLGRQQAANRIVFAEHRTNFATHNAFEERHAAYYARRAAGGAGLIVLEGSVVHPSDWPYEYAIFGYREEVVEGYRLVADAVHRHGALALAHLTHSGGQGTSHYSQAALWAPSPVPEVNSREVPKEMEVEEIAAVVEGFARAARYAIAGGLDGIEVNAGQDSLIRQFLSPMTNFRQDEYGGSPANRLRLAREVIRAVRQAIGQDAVLGLRLSADEYAPWAGLKPEDGAEIARLLASDGQIDYLSVTSGGIYSAHLTRAGLYMPPGYAVHLAATVKAAVDVPVFAQGSIVDPRMAEAVLAEGKADAVEMTRALLADPDLPEKVRAGRLEDVRPCILCNQDCTVRSVQNPRVSCVHNPAAGYECDAAFAPLERAPISRRVLVIGGGPAGLEAARVAALRGHQVTLYERSERLGGAIRLAAAAPGRERLALAVEWLEAQVRALDVALRTGVTVTAEMVVAQAPDAVIVATGGRPGRHPALASQEGARVISPREVLAGEVGGEPGKAVILDAEGAQAAMAAAEWLAGRGWQVEVVTRDMFVGQRLTATLELTPWNQRAAAKGIVFRPQVAVREVCGRAVIGTDLFRPDDEVRIDGVDLIVNAAFEEPDEALYLALKEAGLNVRRAGDCVAPRRLSHAILEGYRAGRAV